MLFFELGNCVLGSLSISSGLRSSFLGLFLCCSKSLLTNTMLALKSDISFLLCDSISCMDLCLSLELLYSGFKSFQVDSILDNLLCGFFFNSYLLILLKDFLVNNRLCFFLCDSDLLSGSVLCIRDRLCRSL